MPKHRLTPRLAELRARLGGTVGWAEAGELLHLMLGVTVSEATIRQRTAAAGTARLAVEAAALAHARQVPALLSLAATNVPLVGGAWTDVHLAGCAALAPGPSDADGHPTRAAQARSAVARGEPAEQFGQTITLAAQRRGVDEARTIVSPHAGAEWRQGLIALVAPQAIRILDPPHAIEHLGTIAALVHGVAALLACLAQCRERGPCATPPPCPDALTPAE